LGQFLDFIDVSTWHRQLHEHGKGQLQGQWSNFSIGEAKLNLLQLKEGLSSISYPLTPPYYSIFFQSVCSGRYRNCERGVGQKYDPKIIFNYKSKI